MTNPGSIGDRLAKHGVAVRTSSTEPSVRLLAALRNNVTRVTLFYSSQVRRIIHVD